MSAIIKQLLQESGLTEQGKWDTMDSETKASILRFAQAVVDTAAMQVEDYYKTDPCGWQLANASDEIQQYFGIITQEVFNHA